jgi:hypothetical protein
VQTYPITDYKGDLFAFEVNNTYLPTYRIPPLLRVIPQVSDIVVRRWFDPPDDVHITFCYQGKKFIVWEPYADNSRYWIGPEDETERECDVRELMDKFQSYEPWGLKRIWLKVLAALKKHYHTEPLP